MERRLTYLSIYKNIDRLPNEEEATLQFYNDFGNSLVKAEVRPDS